MRCRVQIQPIFGPSTTVLVTSCVVSISSLLHDTIMEQVASGVQRVETTGSRCCQTLVATSEGRYHGITALRRMSSAAQVVAAVSKSNVHVQRVCIFSCSFTSFPFHIPRSLVLWFLRFSVLDSSSVLCEMRDESSDNGPRSTQADTLVARRAATAVIPRPLCS